MSESISKLRNLSFSKAELSSQIREFISSKISSDIQRYSESSSITSRVRYPSHKCEKETDRQISCRTMVL